MSKTVTTKTPTGFSVSQEPQEQAKKQQAKSANQQERIEAKLDLILDKLGITL